MTGYWWPAGAPPSAVVRLDITIEEVEGDRRIAFARGRDDVEWTPVRRTRGLS